MGEVQKRFNSMILEISSPFWCELTKDQMGRRRIYGATAENLPTQTEFYDLVDYVSRRKDIRGIYFEGIKAVRAAKDQLNQRIRKGRLDAVIEWVGKLNISPPTMRATQKEVKEKLKEAKEEG